MNTVGPTQPDIFDQAARWHVASLSDKMDWDGFTAWLEADPRHAAAYDDIARVDAVLAAHAAALQSEEAISSPRRRAMWLAGGIAAAAAVALAWLAPGWHSVETRTEQTTDAARTIALADGSQVTLAPRSRLTISGDQLALSGEAHFAIRHDPTRALRIAAGPLTIGDIGTVFDVAVGSGVRIAVNEGQVAVSGAGLAAPMALAQDEGLILAAGGTPQRTTADALGLAGWTGGTLSYDAAPLAVVAEDLARHTGRDLKVDPRLASRRFSGVLTIAPGHHPAHDLAQLAGARIVAAGDHDNLAP